MSINKVLKYSEYLKGKIDFSNHPQYVLDGLVQLAIEYGGPLYFTSSFRTPAQNRACNGSPTSSHLKGLAFDIKCTNSTERWKLLYAINFFGIRRYGVYKNFIHVDFDSSKSQKVTWYG